jgi:AraC-like DNA-binding protein
MADVALAGCSIRRPLPGVEVVVAAPALREFPAHVSAGLGVCVKYGGGHDVTGEGRWQRYPANAVSVRAPGCLWASEAGVHGFVSIDVAPELLPGDWTGGRMGFAGPRALVDVEAAARRMTGARDALEAEQALAQLLEPVLATDIVSSDYARSDAGPASAVADACEFLRAHASDRPSLDAIAAAAGVSKFALLRRFRKALGTTPHAYLVMVRVSRAQALLAAGATPAEAAADAGFADQAHLGVWLKRMLGITPATYRRGAISLQTRLTP